jgi:hypothetical protein
LYGLVQKELARDKILLTLPPLTDEQKNQARSIFLVHLDIKNESELANWMLAEAVDDHQFQCRAERFFTWVNYCEKNFRNQISSLFLKRKSSLDRAVYSLHWVDDEALAHELFIRLKERECSFEQLFCSLPAARDEKMPSGKQGPVALADVPPALAELLRVSDPGQVWPPQRAEDGWVIVQLEELQPSVFNQALKREFALELGDRWLQECIQKEDLIQTLG